MMSKGLETLKTIRHIHDTECGEDKSMNENFDIIEKELKALEIIRNKNQGFVWKEDLTQEEYDLLKEVLL